MNDLKQQLRNVVQQAREKHIELFTEELRLKYKLDDLGADRKIKPKEMGELYGKIKQIQLEQLNNKIAALLGQEKILNNYKGSTPQIRMAPPPNTKDTPHGGGSGVWDAAAEAAAAHGGEWDSTEPAVEDISGESSTIKYVVSSQTSPSRWGIVWQSGGSTWFGGHDLPLADPESGKDEPH